MEPATTPATRPPTRHPNEPSVQGNRPPGGPSHRCGGWTNGEHHHSGPGGHDPPCRAGHPNPDARPPTSGHTPRPIPTTPGVAPQITPGEPHAQCRHPNRTPLTNRWGSTCGVQPILEHAQTATAAEPTAREPGPPPATRASGIFARCHSARGAPPSAQRAQGHVTAGQGRGQFVDATATHGVPSVRRYYRKTS